MSWFQPKARNRVHRHDLKRLDAKVRTRHWAQRQTKLVGMGLFATVAATLLAWGLWMAAAKGFRQMFSENSLYLINEIKVDSTGDSLKPDYVLSRLKLQRGQNLMAVDLPQVRRDLKLFPMVEEAQVSRELPHRLFIRIWERTPVANISAGNVVNYQIDRNGMVMNLLPFAKNSEGLQKRLASLPEITGAAVSDLQEGRKTSSREVFHALALLQKVEQGVDLDIESIDVARRGVLVVGTSDKAVVRVGMGDMENQLKKLARILEDVRQRSEQLQTVDLTIGRDVPVTLKNGELGIGPKN